MKPSNHGGFIISFFHVRDSNRRRPKFGKNKKRIGEKKKIFGVRVQKIRIFFFCLVKKKYFGEKNKYLSYHN